jgi:hypothetical protein
LRLLQNLACRRAVASEQQVRTVLSIYVGFPSVIDKSKELNTWNLQQFSSQKAASLVSRFADH